MVGVARTVCRVAVALATAAAAMAVVAPGASAASAADIRAQAEPLYFGNPVTTNVSTFTTEPNESQTFGVAPVAGACVPSMTRTEWFTLEGTGTEVTIGTAGSIVPAASSGPNDTALAVYSLPAATIEACSNDIVPTADRTSSVTFKTDAHTLYQIQAGIVCGGAVECAPSTARGATLVVTATNTGAPDNDLRANARDIALNSSTHQDNSAATMEPGEIRSCLQTTYERFFSKTVWFKFHVAAQGQVRIRTGGPGADSVITVYRVGSGIPLACNDDDDTQNRQSALTLTVSPGDYALQLGGFGLAHDAATADFPLAIDFTPNFDIDRDGSLSPAGGGADCNDADAATRPGAVDVPNDAIDQNCDGHDAKDGDRDGALAPPDGSDCDDANAAIRPGALEIASNDLDENCDGVKLFDRVGSTIEYKFARGCARRRCGVRLKRYNVTNLPAGATVELSCSGRGCPFKRKSSHVTKARARLPRMALFKHRLLRRGVVLKVTVTAAYRIGIVKRQVVGRADLSTPTTRCLPPGAKTPTKC